MLLLFRSFVGFGRHDTVSAYNSIVTIVKPEVSLLNWQLYVLTPRQLGQSGQRLGSFPSRWVTYLIAFGILRGGAYFTFLSFSPKSKKPKVLSSPLIRVDAKKSGSLNTTRRRRGREMPLPVTPRLVAGRLLVRRVPGGARKANQPLLLCALGLF